MAPLHLLHPVDQLHLNTRLWYIDDFESVSVRTAAVSFATAADGSMMVHCQLSFRAVAVAVAVINRGSENSIASMYVVFVSIQN